MQSGEAKFRATADHLAVHTIVKDGGQWLVQQLPGSLDVARCTELFWRMIEYVAKKARFMEKLIYSCMLLSLDLNV